MKNRRNSNKRSNKLTPTNEMVASMVAMRCRADQDFAKQFQANPKETLSGLVTHHSQMCHNQ